MHSMERHIHACAKVLIRQVLFVVQGHCRYATALHGQCRGRTASQHQHSRDSQALHSGETVRELLTHSDNDPLQIVTVSVSISSPVAFSESPRTRARAASAFRISRTSQHLTLQPPVPLPLVH